VFRRFLFELGVVLGLAAIAALTCFDPIAAVVVARTSTGGVCLDEGTIMVP